MSDLQSDPPVNSEKPRLLSSVSISSLSFAYGSPSMVGVLKQQPEHFYVEEVLGFEPSGEGEHVFLEIEKVGINTQEVADRIARVAAVSARQVSYSGMKDKNAVTRQWFSVQLPGRKDLDWSSLPDSSIRLLQHARHGKKLRRGVHRCNRFRLVLSELAGDTEVFERKLETVLQRGFPNYFGEQRFGRGGMNVHKAQLWFQGRDRPKRHIQGLYLSAVRAFLFNQILSRRVSEQSWDQVLEGELVMLDGSQSLFEYRADDDSTKDIPLRLASGDIHPTGPMYGASTGMTASAQVAQLEQEVLATYPDLLRGLEHAGAKAQRRPLRVIPSDLQWQQQNNRAEITFTLPRGCFATALVRELVSE